MHRDTVHRPLECGHRFRDVPVRCALRETFSVCGLEFAAPISSQRLPCRALKNNYPEQGVENLRSAGVKGGGYSCFLARPLSCQRHFGCGALRCRGAFRRIDRPTPGDSILPSHLRHSEGPLRNSDWSWSPTFLHSTRGRWPFNLPLKASNRHPRSDCRQRQQASREELFDQGFPHGSPLPLGWKSTASGERPHRSGLQASQRGQEVERIISC